jgi:Mor family transcriptional regulator
MTTTDIIYRLNGVVGQHFPVCVEAADEIASLRAKLDSALADLKTKAQYLEMNDELVRVLNAELDAAIHEKARGVK